MTVGRVDSGHDCMESGTQPLGHVSGHPPVDGQLILVPQEQQ